MSGPDQEKELILVRLSELTDNLQSLMSSHRELYEITRSERQALIDADTKTLEMLVTKKEMLLEHILRLDQKRRALCHDITPGLTLLQIIDHLEGRGFPQSTPLRSTRQALQILITRIQEINASNQLLIDSSLKHVEAMKINALGTGAGRSPVYGRSGQRGPALSGARHVATER